MPADIVMRLRATALDKDNFPRMDSERWCSVGLAKEAADEIERLRQPAGVSEETIRSVVGRYAEIGGYHHEGIVAGLLALLNRPQTGEVERLRAALETIAKTTFSGDQVDPIYQQGNKDAHETCSRMARAALAGGKRKVLPVKASIADEYDPTGGLDPNFNWDGDR